MLIGVTNTRFFFRKVFNFFSFSLLIMKKPEDMRRLIHKIIIIVFLVLIVIGFTVPTLLDEDSSTNKAQPRLCKTDADCYLMCNEVPIEVLCSQNLCWQNSCEEESPYPFNHTPTTFRLDIKINEESLTPKADSANLFVKAEGEKISVYAQGLSLDFIVEKFGIMLNGNCITTNQSYCNNEIHKLGMKVNGIDAYAFGNYVPQEGELVEIGYK